MGTATKEVMVTAPLIVLLYDRTFLAGSFGQALRKRWGLYAGLFACWGLLAYLMIWGPGRGSTAGFQAEGGLNWQSYGLTQLSAIPHYLRLTFWPDALCLDYGPWVKTTPREFLPGAILVAAMAAATIWGLCRGRKWGFLGAWFLGILAPTSSIVPIRDTLFEHRMYLSLAAVASLVVLGVFLLWRRLFAGQWAALGLALVLVAGALGYCTVLRNVDYQSTLAIWQDTAEQCPSNTRAHCNLGLAYENQGEHDLAASEYRIAIGLDPRYAEAYYNLGVTLMGTRDYDSAIEQFRQAIRLDPQFAEAHYNLGFALSSQGKYEEGIEQLQSAIRDKPQLLESYNVLGAVLLKQGKIDPAIETFRQAIRMKPQYSDGHNGLGVALESQGNFEEAIEHFRLAIQANPRFLTGYKNLARVLDKTGRNQEAQEVRRQAAQLESGGR
jgi:Tfp pilus assembly protein PilF